MASARDLRVAKDGEHLLLDFLQRPVIHDALGRPHISVVHDYATNWQHGDIRLAWDTGATAYIEHKVVHHNLLADLPARSRPDATFADPGNTFTSTIVEVAKLRDSDTYRPEFAGWLASLADHLGYADWREVAALRLRDSRPAGSARDYSVPAFTTMRLGDVGWQAHTNLHPYVGGSLAAFVDVTQRSINFHRGADLLAAVRASADRNGLYYSPGFTDPDTILARHIRYGAGRFAQDVDGRWWRVGAGDPVALLTASLPVPAAA